jgi:hypothetical protein
MKRFLAAQAAAATLVLLAATCVQAGPLPSQVQWSYNFTPGSYSVSADTNPSAGVSFTNEPTKSAVGNSDVVATNLRIFGSTASPSTPDTLTTHGAYTISLLLGTSANGPALSGTLTFTGKLGGTFSSASANVSNMFGPNSTQQLTLGNYTFTVALIAYTPPGPANQLNAGSISAHVTVANASIHTTGGGTPEPSTMLLSGLGLTFLGGAAWRKRRQARRVGVAV